MFKIICTPKHYAFNDGGDLWSFTNTFSDGTTVIDEPLMPEANEMINSILQFKYKEHKDIDMILITFSQEEPEDFDVCLNYDCPDDDGSRYKAVVENKSSEVWLCPVLDKFFPEGKPKELFVTIEGVT